jgi:hypothetical protein
VAILDKGHTAYYHNRDLLRLGGIKGHRPAACHLACGSSCSPCLFFYKGEVKRPLKTLGIRCFNLLSEGG